jgi:ParB family chromosome partitioning protein
MDDRQAAIVNLTENLERKDLNVLEEAITLDKLFPPYRTIRSIAKELHKSEDWVSLRRNLMTQSEFVQKAAASGRLGMRDLRLVIHAPDSDLKAKQILRAEKQGRKASVVSPNRPKKKSETQALVSQLLGEGFSPQLLRLLTWTTGELSDNELQEALTWLRDRKGWLK